MKKNFWFLIAFIPFFSLVARGDLPTEGGNGGDLLNCRPSTENPFQGLTSLDYVATYKKSNGNKDIVSVDSTKSSLQRIAGILKEKAPSLYPSFAEFTLHIRNEDYSKARVWEESSFGLVPINDEVLLNLMPENCLDSQGKMQIIQAVRRETNPGIPGPIIYRYIPQIFEDVEQNKPLHASFLLVHEWLWDHSLNVDRNRRINRFLHSERAGALSSEQFVAQLKGMGLNVTEDPIKPSPDWIWATAQEHFCIRAKSGTECWGAWYSNELNRLANLLLSQTENLSHVTMGRQHICVASPTGVECATSGVEPQFINNVPVLSGVKSLVSGFYHVCALHSEGVYCWGDPESKIPSNVTDVVELSAKSDQTCALKKGRTVKDVVCWGEKWSKDAVKPRYFTPDTPISQISAGGKHVCALSNGTVDCWGENNFGQAGAPKLSGIIQIASLGQTSCALSPTRFYCWGEFQWNGPAPKFKNAKAIIGNNWQFCVHDDLGVGCWQNNGANLTQYVPETFRRQE